MWSSTLCKWITVLLLSGLAAASCTSTTTNIALNIPDFDCPNWDLLLNQNFTLLDNFLSGQSAYRLPSLLVGTLSINGIFTSTLPDGTAPFTVTSTTPVTNLTTEPLVYNFNGVQQLHEHFVHGSCVLSSGSCTNTLSGSAAFTGNSTYHCWCADQSAVAACRINKTDGSHFNVEESSGTNTVAWGCVGN